MLGKILIALFITIILIASYFIYNNLNYYKKYYKRVKSSGFVEKQYTLPDNTVLNYAEGPKNGVSLLLIHAQTAAWQDYSKVLPKLSKNFHVFVIDCHGHGKSSKDPSKYSAKAMSKDIINFVKTIIKTKVIVSGNSSGGLIAAYLAANYKSDILALVLEDPPLFSSEKNRCENTFAYLDSFKPISEYYSYNSDSDYVLHYLKNCYWLKFFGNGRTGILNYATKYRQKNPNSILKIFFLPESITTVFRYMDNYDPKFGLAFYDLTWFNDFNHQETLKKIICPTILIHANYQYQNGILLGAMDNNDAQLASELISNCELIKLNSKHVVHNDKPNEFIKIMYSILDKIS